jgi:hypothetical protein
MSRENPGLAQKHHVTNTNNILQSLSALHIVRSSLQINLILCWPKTHKSESAEDLTLQLDLSAMSKLQSGLSLVGSDAASLSNYDVSKVGTDLKVYKQRAN